MKISFNACAPVTSIGNGVRITASGATRSSIVLEIISVSFEVACESGGYAASRNGNVSVACELLCHGDHAAQVVDGSLRSDAQLSRRRRVGRLRAEHATAASEPTSFRTSWSPLGYTGSERGWRGAGSAWCSRCAIKTLPTVIACIDATLRRFGGAPAYGLSDNEKTLTVDHIAVRHPTMVDVGGYYGLTLTKLCTG